MVQDASGAVDSSGGTVAVTDSSSPLAGASVVVPPGAVASVVTISISHALDPLPHPGDPDAAFLSQILVLERSEPGDFLTPVAVTLPYRDPAPEPGDVPAAYYWDETYGSYGSVTTLARDQDAQQVTFETLHFSSYVVGKIRGLARSLLDLPPFDTGFRPSVDGFFHPNFGGSDIPGGCCSGMATYSAWYHKGKRLRPNLRRGESTVGRDPVPLHEKYRDGDREQWEDDATARELISLAFARVLAPVDFWRTLGLLRFYVGSKFAPDGREVGLELLQNLRWDGPQILIFGWPKHGGGRAYHAVTVYGYWDGKFWIYDNEAPGAEVPWEWDWRPWPLGGLGTYGRSAGLPPIDRVIVCGVSSLIRPSDFEDLYQTIEAPGRKFKTFSLVSPQLVAGRATVPSGSGLEIRGRLTGGQAGLEATHVACLVDLYLAAIVELGPGDDFVLALPPLQNPSASISLVATTLKGGSQSEIGTRLSSGSSVWRSYAGYARFEARTQGSFLDNLGFERGDLSGWTSETHTWLDERAGSFQPTKVAIQAGGNDPIATSLRRVDQGRASCRVNDEDWDYHVSTVTRTLRIPETSTAPELRIRWAAVLEDGYHPAAEQPYVEVQATDDTTGQVLYAAHYNATDPAWRGGWLRFGQKRTEVRLDTPTECGEWWAIDWQTARIPLTAARGHLVTLRVAAGDCANGGHGGYAYIDAAE